MTKQEIIKNIRSTKIDINIWVHEYMTLDYYFHVRTYRFAKRPADQVQTSDLQCKGTAANKKEFVSIIHEIINSK